VPQLFENYGVSHLPGLIADNKAGEAIFSMTWLVHDVSRANLDLLLSERPCLLQGSALSGDCLLALPLSPTMLFFACNQPDTVVSLRATPETKLVKAVNKISVSYAADRVYGTSNQHLPLVEKYLGQSPVSVRS